MNRHFNLAITMSSPKVGLSCIHGRAVVDLKTGPFFVNDEPWLVRTISLSTGTRIGAFRDAVRDRDRRCVVTGRPAHRAEYDIWWGFEAAHIFPLAYEGHWKDNDYRHWITIPAATESAGTINSVQNGMLLESAIHQLFDGYDFSINPDVCMSLSYSSLNR